MRCISPLEAWQTSGGEIVFVERGDIRRPLTLRCGQCITCRLERSRQWAVRCVNEASLHDVSSFVTLTYRPELCSQFGESLNYRDFQLFMKRLRKKLGAVRFFMCGEYGTRFMRPHFHACLFGIHFADKRLFSKRDGVSLYSSPLLDSLWTHGYASIGDVTFDSAAYVARYCVSKVVGRKAAAHYERMNPFTGEIFSLQPEFCRMSLRPGIGARWIEQYCEEVVVHDGVVTAGKLGKSPRFYDNYLKEARAADWEGIEFDRYRKSLQFAADSTPERLSVLQTCAEAKLRSKGRSLE